MILVTFSGLDGCGKSTQVRLACDALNRRGLRVYRLVTLFTSVTGVLTLLREARRRKRKPNPTTLAATESKVRSYARGRTFDADRRTSAAQLRRWVAYPIDCVALSLWLVVIRLRGYDAVVCDRYIYDKMVNLPKPNCALSRWMCRLTPRPTCAFLLDVSPETASARRDEHTLDYFVTKHAAYRQVLEMGIGLRAIGGDSVEQVARQIELAIPAVAHRSRSATQEEAQVQA